MHLIAALRFGPNFHSLREALEELGQVASVSHGGFDDLPRHEQYDFRTSSYYQKVRTNSSSFTLQERLESDVAYCTPELLHTGLLKSPGAFYETPDGQYYFEPDECRLRRFSGQQVRECFAGRHVDFLGDSVTRQAAGCDWHLLSDVTEYWRCQKSWIVNI